jgi:hypothetical protein
MPLYMSVPESMSVSMFLSRVQVRLCINKRVYMFTDSPTERRKTGRRMTERRMTERRKTGRRMTERRMTERQMTEHRMTEHRKTIGRKIPNTE